MSDASQLEGKPNDAKPAEGKAEGDKPRNPIQPRIDELVRDRTAAQKERDEARQRAEAAERRAAELEAKLNPPKVEETAGPEPAPDPKDFKDASEWSQAFAEWSKEAARREIAAEAEQKEEARKRQEAESADRARAGRFASAEQEYAKDTPDYTDVVAKADFRIANFLADAMIDSNVGPQMRYYFAKNPSELDRLHAMRPHTALTEFGRLEQQFMKRPQKGDEPAAGSLRAVPRPAEQSRAPEPIDPLKATAAAVEKPRGQMTYQEWKAARLAGRIK